MTERETIGLHHEINVLMERYGISYKDAAHRLYMTETEKIRTDNRAKKAFGILADRTRSSLLNIREKFNEVSQTLGQDSEADESGEDVPEAGGL